MVPSNRRSYHYFATSSLRPEPLLPGVGGFLRWRRHPPLSREVPGHVAPDRFGVRSGCRISDYHTFLLSPVAKPPPDLPFFTQVKESVRFELTARGSLPPTFHAYVAAAIFFEQN